MSSRKIRALGGLLALALIASACGGTNDSASPEQPSAPSQPATGGDEPAVTGGTVRIRIGADVSSIDPHGVASGVEGSSVMEHVFNGLLRYDEETNAIIPDLAREWEVSPDGLTYTFRLHEGIQFHRNYGEFTANDVKFSLDRALDPETGSAFRGVLLGIDEIIVENDYNLRIVLTESNSVFPDAITAWRAGQIVSQAAIEDLGDEAAAVTPIGTGPFEFVSWSPGDRVVLEAFDDHWRGRPAIDRVEFIIIAEEAAAEVAVRTGEIDVFFMAQSPEVLNRMRTTENVTVQERASFLSCSVILNHTVEPLGDVRVRQAMSHALNRVSLVEDFFQDSKILANGNLTPAFTEYTEDVPSYPYDPERARQLLAEAGYPNGFDFEFIGIALAPYDQIPVALAPDLEAVGINVSINVLERASYGQARAAGTIPSGITCALGTNSLDMLGGLFSSGSFPPGLNTAQYSGVDDLLNQARRAVDDNRRTELIQEVVRQTMRDAVIIPLYSDILYMPVGNQIDGAILTSRFTVRVDQATRVAG